MADIMRSHTELTDEIMPLQSYQHQHRPIIVATEADAAVFSCSTVPSARGIHDLCSHASRI